MEKRFVSFSSAGTQGVLFNGALNALEQAWGGESFRDWVNALAGAAGCSAGTLAMLMLVLKLTRAQRDAVLRGARFDHLFDTAELAGVPEHLGAFRLTEVRRTVRAILDYGGLSPTVTLEAMHAFVRTHCVFVVTDVTRMACVHVSHETHPQMTVVDAVCASCAIPLLFRPMYVDGHLLVDGCVTQSVPDAFARAQTLFLVVLVQTHEAVEMTWCDYCTRLTSLTTRTDAFAQDLVAQGHAVCTLSDASFMVDPFLGEVEIARMTRNGFLAVLEALHPGVRAAACVAVRQYVRNRLTVDITTTDAEAAPPRADGDGARAAGCAA